MLHAAGIVYMIIFPPADAFILQWHYHYRHNCISKPPRDASLLQNPLAHHNTLPLGRGLGFPARPDITPWEWIKHGHFPPLSLLIIDCLGETTKKMGEVNWKSSTPCVSLNAKTFANTLSNSISVQFLTYICQRSYWKEFDIRATTLRCSSLWKNNVSILYCIFFLSIMWKSNNLFQCNVKSISQFSYVGPWRKPLPAFLPQVFS